MSLFTIYSQWGDKGRRRRRYFSGMNAVRLVCLFGLIAFAAWLDAKQGAAEGPSIEDIAHEFQGTDSLRAWVPQADRFD